MRIQQGLCTHPSLLNCRDALLWEGLFDLCASSKGGLLL